MSKTVVIGLVGPRGSGKDTVYSIIKELYANRKDVSIHRTAFADPIKHKIENLFRLNEASYQRLKRAPRVTLEDGCGVITVLSGREIVRGIGMLMRSYDNGLQFDSHVINDIQAISMNPNDPTDLRIVLVTDVRFPTDADIVRRMGGVLVRVYREGVDYDGHVTERPLDEIDYTINNSGTKEECRLEVENLLKEIINACNG